MKHLLFLHGAIGAKEQLQPLADALKDKYTVHTSNFSGHGGEPFSDKGFSIPVFADEVLSYIRQHKIETLNIFGYSMGGYVAMWLAKRYPLLINKIVTLATKFHWDEAIAEKEVKMLDAETILQKVPAFAEQLRRRHEPNDWKELLEKTKEMLLQLGRKNMIRLDGYKEIPHECLLLLGDKDKMVTMDETIAVQRELQNAKFRLLPNTPHPIEQVDVGMLEGIIAEFIGNGKL